MSHTDFVSTIPDGFKLIADTDNCPCAGIANDDRKLYGVQFHPESVLTPNGAKMLRNFIESMN